MWERDCLRVLLMMVTVHMAACTLEPSPARAGTIMGAAVLAIDPRDPSQSDPASAPPRLEDGRTLLVVFDFGPRGNSLPRTLVLSAGVHDPRFGWHGGMVTDRLDRSARNPLVRDFIEGEDATFSFGVTPGDAPYRISLFLADGRHGGGGVDLLVGGEPAATGVVAPEGGTVRVDFEVRPVRGRISFRLRAAACGAFAVTGARVYGPPDVAIASTFGRPDSLRSAVPPPDSLDTTGRVEPRKLLQLVCRHLMKHRLSDGGFSMHGAWYENSFPIRALLSGSSLLVESSWSEAAFDLLDRFVADQHPDGNWCSSYFGRPGCRLSGRADTTSANLADIGSMTLCLAMAAPLADRARQERYVQAIVLYADSIVIPTQLASGAFPNRLWGGLDHRHPYSVATATQAASLALLYAVTEKPDYLAAAERAALWLARDVQADGRILFHPHDSADTRINESNRFGDNFYIMEALSIVGHYSADPATQRELRAASARWLRGSAGLMARTEQGYWWAPRDLWSDAKMAAMPLLLSRYAGMHRDTDMNLWIRRTVAWLADPGLSRRIGVRAHPAGLQGDYSMVATGFAGIGVAGVIDPWSLIPVPEDLRPLVAVLEDSQD